jgi:UDP-glucose 4-epimerase
MKIAITGGSGFLGKEVISLIEKNRVETPIILGRLQSSEDNKNQYRQTNYTTESLKDVLKDIDSVIHLAAVRGANGAIADFHQNEIITENLYNSCTKLGIKNIVYASSISVYSDGKKIPWKERQVLSPKTFYGISKVACEYIGEIYHRKYGLNIKALRFAHILGESERKGFMMNTFIDNAFQNKTLNVNGKSIAKREFVYVKDAARAIVMAMHRPEMNGTFNIGSGEAFSNLEVALIVNECFNNEGNLQYNNSVEEEIEASFMDSSKAGYELGYHAQFLMKEALEDIKNIKNTRTQ